VTSFDLYQATGLTPQELAEVLQNNPRAYMAVRGAVAEKHLDKVLDGLCQAGGINSYRRSAGDSEKDFYLQVGNNTYTIECKNVEAIKTQKNQGTKVSYIEYLAEKGYISSLFIDNFMKEIHMAHEGIEMLSSSELKSFFKQLPQKYRESSFVKYEYSASKVPCPQLGILSDDEFVAQFNDFPITIDFQRTRNSTDEDGGTRRNRYYRVGEIDIVAACLFSRTMEWKFLYARAEEFERHKDYPDRYSNKLRLQPGLWTSNLQDLIST